MKRRKVFWVILLIFLYGLFSSDILSLAEEPMNGEVIILIDVSGTMQQFSDSVKRYADFLDKDLRDTGIKVTWKAFADPGYIKTICSGRLTEENGKANLDNLEFKEEWTDHKGALEDTIKEMEQSDAQWKCIVMLSDALLDYDNKEYGDSEEEERAENQAKDNFVQMVDEFAKEPSQKVVLVYFGDECGLFERCRRADVLEGGRAPGNIALATEVLEENQELTEDVLDNILEGTGLESHKVPVEMEGNQARFKLDEDAYRMVFRIRGSGTADEKMDISMMREDGEIVEEYSRSRWANMGLFFFADVQAGNYTVNLPDGEWECAMTVRKKVSVYDVEVSILQGNIRIREEESIFYVNDSHFTLDIQVKTNQDKEDGSDRSGELNSLGIRYSIVPAVSGETNVLDDSYKDVSSGYHEDSDSFQQEVNVDMLDGDYECRIRIMEGEKIEYESIPYCIRFIGPTTPPTTEPPPEENIYTEDDIDLRDEFGIPEERGNYYIKINGEDFAHINGENTGRRDVRYKNGKLKFMEKGSYEVSVILEGDMSFKMEKKYNVSEKCLFMKLWEMIFGKSKGEEAK